MAYRLNGPTDPLRLLAKRFILLGRRSVSGVPTTKLFINGQFIESKASQWIDVHNPVKISNLRKLFTDSNSCQGHK